MSEASTASLTEARSGHGEPPKCIGIVVHPSRNVDRPLRLLKEWAREHSVEVVQIAAGYDQRQIAEEGDAADADLVVSIGGDGTTLAAMRCAALVNRPVLGIACGSLGALATVAVDDVPRSLDRFSRSEWRPRIFPALSVAVGPGQPAFALNDVAVVRAGGGQVLVTATIDGSMYAHLAGDGAIVSTPTGSSGYAISAGGPLLAPALDGFVFTPLPKHGGFCPPLVIGPRSQLQLDIAAGFGGARLEIDGQVIEALPRTLAISLREGVVTMVSFDDQETLFAGLRRRRILLDSPRVSADASAPGEGCP